MAIPDFFGQQQSSLRSGMQLGQGLQQYKSNEQAMDLQSQQADMAQQRFGMEQERFGMEMESAELDIDKRKQAALMRNLLQDTAILTSLGPEEQEKFIEPLKQKYRSVDGMGNAIGELFNKPYKERMESLYTFLHASKDTAPPTAGEQEFNALIKGFTPEERERAKRIKAGLLPRAVGSASSTLAETGGAEAVAQVEETISGARERGQLKEQLAIKPEIQYAVDSAKALAQAEAEKAGKERSDESAWNVYSVGMKGLMDGLSGSDTGPFVGRLPAITTAQQIADGGVSAMAPILKQMFRTAGEGIFTDKDQDLLMKMVPTRTDTPEAIQAKLANINSIVMAKLGKDLGSDNDKDDRSEDEILRQYGL